ncbi:MAG: SDR family oxidoreductase [Sciscionella sp.]
MTDTVAMVTGASSGIGAATAHELAGLGATVALVARRANALEALAEQLRAAGGQALSVVADLTDPAAVDAAISAVVTQAGRLDILINNAGIGYLRPVREGELDEWRQMVQINLLGSLYCTRAALPHLAGAARGERGVADLVMISSAAGRVARAGNGVYAATKHAVNAFSESLRQEITAEYVRVGVVEPGMVTTELTVGDTGGPPPVGSEHFGWLAPGDIASAVGYMVTRPRHAAVNEILIRPTEQR